METLLAESSLLEECGISSKFLKNQRFPSRERNFVCLVSLFETWRFSHDRQVKKKALMMS